METYSYDPNIMFEKAVRWHVAFALQQNEEAKSAFDKAKANWLENAAVLKALGKPLPPKPRPAPKITVQADGKDSPDQSKIESRFGSELVADPNFDLPVMSTPTPGTVQVGEQLMPGIWAIGPNDSAPIGTQTTAPNGKVVVKVLVTPFGRGFYREV